ncbi:LysR family transcriptional regulator [Shewanella alkalitolerans]|uniref:LysR family transcriptional regulator n=1 Tax=Shewanella alkalitolerans TaxID=2864209 RepID=UPI001C6618FE|nr:LysR family transcriptional regulator [Shewanella alkalitolerans]QYJ97914.1 LysR family transcriptional regulator [Shewanella alkalitolerans]
MNKVDQLNYNQLKVFIAVYEHGQSHQAANELGITASGVSRTLKILRDIFKDSLFVRRNSGFVATEKAHQLIPLARDLVADYQRLEQQHSVFTPAESGGQYVIHAYDEFIYAVQKVIRNEILTEAPNMKFDVRVLTRDCSSDLANGDVDFVVVYEAFNGKHLNAEMFSATDSLYILARSGHPVFEQAISLTNLAHYPCLEIDNYDDLSNPLLVDLCREYGLNMEVEGYTDSVATAMRLLSESDAIILVCNEFTRELVDMLPGIRWQKMPNDLATLCRTRRRKHRDIGNYLVYGKTNQSQAYLWVKARLINGLANSWRVAAARE